MISGANLHSFASCKLSNSLLPIKVRQKLKSRKIRLIQRQEIWMLTVQGWIMALIFTVTLFIFGITHIHSFLAASSPVNANILVVEGWMPDYGLKQALAEFERGSYCQIITTGMPLERGSYLVKYKNYAELAAATLRTLGLEPEKVIPVSAPEVIKDRTYASAVALRQWLAKENLKPKAINVYTHSVHARRSWLIFTRALAPEIKVGVISVRPLDYDPKQWWRYSAGVRRVIDELVGYIYVKFFSWNT